MQTKSLFISAGHSDTDPGAVGNGYTEAEIGETGVRATFPDIQANRSR